jgi:hypothetical protein
MGVQSLFATASSNGKLIFAFKAREQSQAAIKVEALARGLPNRGRFITTVAEIGVHEMI